MPMLPAVEGLSQKATIKMGRIELWQEVESRTDWSTLADTLTDAEFAHAVIALAEPVWRRGSNPEERFQLLQQQMRAEITEAVDILQEGLTDADKSNDWIIIESFAKRIRGSIRRNYYMAYGFGRETSNPFWIGFQQWELDSVRGLIEEEYFYLRGFTADLREKVRAGEELGWRLGWRADLYGDSLAKAWQMGLAAGRDEQDIITIQPGPNTKTHCAVCPTHWGQWTRRQYETEFEPPMPPANRCEGRGRCHCRITVNRAIPFSVHEISRGLLSWWRRATS